MKNSNLVNVNDMAAARENRVEMQKLLLEKIKVPVISFTLNIPGPEKNKGIFRKIHKKGIEEIEKYFSGNIKEKIVKNLKTGSEAFFAVDLNVEFIKEKTISIEDNYHLGRIFDIDVINTKGIALSRTERGMPRRKCLICNKQVSLCSRNRSHSVNELLNKIHQLSKNLS